MANEYYSVLQISPTASRDEIKNSYARIRRELAINNDETELTLLLEAKSTLLDDVARREYDLFQTYGEEIQELEDEAAEEAENDNWNEVIIILKRLCVILPDNSSILNRLAIAYLHNDDPLSATKIYDSLLKTHTDSALYFLNAGIAYLELAKISGFSDNDSIYIEFICRECKKSSNTKITSKYEQFQCYHCGHKFRIYAAISNISYSRARFLFESSISIDSKSSSPYVQMAFTYVADNDYDKSIEWINKAIYADGVVDINDLEDLFLICCLYARMNNITGLKLTAVQISKLVEDKEYNDYILARFYKLTIDAIENINYREAALLFETLIHIKKDGTDFSDTLKMLRKAADSLQEWSNLFGDNNIIQSIKDYIYYEFISNPILTDLHDNDESQKKFVAIIDELEKLSPISIKAKVVYLKSKYPKTYCLESRFENILIEIETHISTLPLGPKPPQPPQPPPPKEAPSCGCIIALIIICIIGHGIPIPFVIAGLIYYYSSK